MYSTEPLQQAPQTGDVVKIIRRKTKSGEQITFMPSGRAPNLEYSKLKRSSPLYNSKRQSAMQAAFGNSDAAIIGERSSLPQTMIKQMYQTKHNIHTVSVDYILFCAFCKGIAISMLGNSRRIYTNKQQLQE